jgi:polar amino acid transport system substrate-binding protein
MKWHPRRRTLLAVPMLALALLASVQARDNACSKAITVATGHWEPYAYYDAQKRFVGLDAEMTRAIFDEAGCTLVELAPMPPIRNLYLFDRGEIDLLTGSSETPERRKRAWFSLPYRDERVALFALAGRVELYKGIRSFADVMEAPVSLLAPRAGWYGVDYEKSMVALKDGGRLSQFVDFQQGIRMLAAGRGNFILGDAVGIEHAAVREGVKVQPLPFWLVDADVHLMLSRATVSEADVRRLDAAIERLQKRGTLEKIRRFYGGM